MITTSPTWWQLAISPHVIKRSAKTALVVGTLLAVINHGDALLTLELSSDRIFKILLTYFVPYLVSTSASIGAIRQQEKKD